jgi:hypothetical protein
MTTHHHCFARNEDHTMTTPQPANYYLIAHMDEIPEHPAMAQPLPIDIAGTCANDAEALSIARMCWCSVVSTTPSVAAMLLKADAKLEVIATFQGTGGVEVGKRLIVGNEATDFLKKLTPGTYRVVAPLCGIPVTLPDNMSALKYGPPTTHPENVAEMVAQWGEVIDTYLGIYKDLTGAYQDRFLETADTLVHDLIDAQRRINEISEIWWPEGVSEGDHEISSIESQSMGTLAHMIPTWGLIYTTLATQQALAIMSCVKPIMIQDAVADSLSDLDWDALLTSETTTLEGE